MLIAGTVFAAFAAIYYWFPKMTGRLLDERLGKLHFWLMFVGFCVTFMPMYALGPLGMPRRVYTYARDVGWNGLNLVSTLGAYVIAAAIIVFVVNLRAQPARRGAVAGDDPWDAWTLEWATTSPPPPGNFAALPPIHSDMPLWDLEQVMPRRRKPVRAATARWRRAVRVDDGSRPSRSSRTAVAVLDGGRDAASWAPACSARRRSSSSARSSCSSRSPSG